MLTVSLSKAKQACRVRFVYAEHTSAYVSMRQHTSAYVVYVRVRVVYVRSACDADSQPSLSKADSVERELN